jgi:hypothetical protein
MFRADLPAKGPVQVFLQSLGGCIERFDIAKSVAGMQLDPRVNRIDGPTPPRLSAESASAYPTSGRHEGIRKETGRISLATVRREAPVHQCGEVTLFDATVVGSDHS